MTDSFKPQIGKLFLLAILTGAACLLASSRAHAQIFTNLHNFSAILATTNADGANPSCSLVASGNLLYGTTEDGGKFGSGAIFAISTNGAFFTNLYSFTFATNNGTGFDTNRDGESPSANLILVSNLLYGTAEFGGLNGRGTLFALHIDGTGFTNLHSFALATTNSVFRYTNADGAEILCGLTLYSNELFGTASGGGTNGNGTIFRLNLDGTDFTNLHNFSALPTNTVMGAGVLLGNQNTNADGYYPQAGLALASNQLFGTATYGGTFGEGVVFRINPDGTGFTNLHNFSTTVSATNADGTLPFGGLTFSGTVLYGITTYGGVIGDGTVYVIHPDGSGFTNLYNFHGPPSDGEAPFGNLVVSGNMLYGTTEFGGKYDEGAVYEIHTDGSGPSLLHSFTTAMGTYPNYYNQDGYQPYAGLLLLNNVLYGTTLEGGITNSGVVFGVVPSPTLGLEQEGANIVLNWQTNFPGYTLESLTNMDLANWSAVSPSPVVVNGENTVTNPVTSTQRFYRLNQ